MASCADVSNCNSNNFSINELLAYVNYYRKRCLLDNLKKVVINFYSLEEISDAKDVLLVLCKNHLGDKPGRRGSAMRSVQEADFADMLNAFLKLDELNLSIPVFVPINLSRLPRYDPEVNVFALTDSLAVFKHELTSVKQDVSMFKSQPPEIAPVKKVESPSFLNLYSGVVALPPVSSSTVSKSVSIYTSSRPLQDKFRSLPAVNKPVSEGIAKKVDASSSNYNFTLVTNKRQQRRVRLTVVGTKKDAEFRGCHPRVDLFVSRFPSEYSVEHVRKLITGIFIEVLTLVKVSHVDALAASFKLSIYRDDEQKALDPGSWPEFVVVRRYIQRRRNVHRVQETQVKPIESNWDNDDPSMWDHLPDDE